MAKSENVDSKEFPTGFIDYVNSIKAKRPRILLDHLIKYGQISTEELTRTYGYGHPPRAARDARERGIPLETVRVIGEDGRSIAAYRFGDLTKINYSRYRGLQVGLKNSGMKCMKHMVQLVVFVVPI